MKETDEDLNAPEPGPEPKRDQDLELKAYLARWWRELFQLHGPAWRCFWGLLVRPGKVAVAHCESGDGISSTYPIHPIRLYLIVNLLFFLAAPLIETPPTQEAKLNLWQVGHAPVTESLPAFDHWVEERAKASGFESREYRAIFDAWMSSLQGSLVLVWIPILGVVSFFSYRKRRSFLVQHLIFSTHFLSFILLSLLAAGASSRVVLLVLPETAGMLVTVVLLLSWTVWMAYASYGAVRDFHDLRSRGRTIWLTTCLWMGFGVGFWTYLRLLFLWTLFNLRNLSAPPG